MANLYKYRIWCNTENMYYEIWREEDQGEPQSCPNNSGHEIDTTKTTITDKQIDEGPKDPSGKMRIHQTSRPLGTKVHFTSRGDHRDYVSDAGGGDLFKFDHHLEDPIEQVVYLDFNTIENTTYVHEGYMIWKNANFDMISLDFVPDVTQVEEQLGGEVFIAPTKPYLILPAEIIGGAGSHTITGDLSHPRGGLVYMPQAGDPQWGRPTAFWDADYNTETHLFENIRPRPNGDGCYNLFSIEIAFARFANDILMLHNGFEHLKTSDTEEIGQGMRIRATATTNMTEGDHDWSCACILTLHRQRSV
jgi:hypothetical protein